MLISKVSLYRNHKNKVLCGSVDESVARELDLGFFLQAMVPYLLISVSSIFIEWIYCKNWKSVISSHLPIQLHIYTIIKRQRNVNNPNLIEVPETWKVNDFNE